MPNAVPPPISEGDREATLRRLQEAFAEGHISHAEMDEHLQAVLTALSASCAGSSSRRIR